MAEATYRHEDDTIQKTEAAAISSGQVTQLPDGRAAVKDGLNDSIAGDPVSWRTEGVVDLAKTASEVIDWGDIVMWDSSANTATMQHSGNGDFVVGVCVQDSAAADTAVRVELNAKPTYHIDVRRDGIEMTAEATDGLGVEPLVGGIAKLAFDAVAEVAQAALFPATKTTPIATGAITEFRINVIDNGDDAALDLNIGLANASHATDADAITEAVFVHIDGNVLNLLAESDDGTTEVAATDTTVDYAEGTPFWIKIDTRDSSDVQVYINGALVLSGSTFDLSAGTGPLFPIVHMEKTSNDTTADVDVLEMRQRRQAA